ncbi:hypothetical protein GTW73_00500 [Streptomyces sp. SID4982]|nr:hypothetical protein [Streptomyces sp. SID4982]
MPIVRVKDVRNGRIDTSDPLRVSPDVEVKYSRTRLQGGEVLLTLVGTTGQVAIASDRLAGWNVARAIGVLRPISDISPRWLQYFIESEDAQQYIREHLNTTVQATLNLKDVRVLPVPLPSGQEREGIISVIGALDDKIAVNEHIATTALNLAEALYVQAADSSVWQSVKLGDAARWMSGGTPKTSEPSYWGGAIPWISALSLKSPWIDRSDRNVTELGAASGTRLVPADTVLFVVRGSSLKEEFRIGITQCEVAFGQDCKALIARGGIDSHALFHSIRSQTTSILEMVDETSIGAGRLSTDLISALEIRVPNDPSDPTVAQVRNLDCLAATKRQESQTLTTLRDTLLPQLMSGRLRVKDAEKIVEDHA